VPAGAVIRVPRALSGIIGRKGSVGGYISRLSKTQAQLGDRNRNGMTRGCERLAELMV
jgi:hypothetical protein